VDFVARQVEPWPEERARLAAKAGTETIPVLETDDGTLYRGTRAIFAYVESLRPWEHAREHRRRFLDHAPARESDAVGQLVALAELPTDEGPETWDESEAVVTDRPDETRYELWLGHRLVGFVAYHLRGSTIALTHAEVEPWCQGHGLGSRLVAAALEDGRARGLTVVPLCPFVAAYMAQHPETQDLAAGAYRAPPR
jgi:predicted GNAT family acetyltransferase